MFSRRFVKSFPALAVGFETETEFTVHALALHMPVQEVRPCTATAPPGAISKLHTIGDGMRILRAIATLIQQERPLELFSLAALVVRWRLGSAWAYRWSIEFLHTGLVPRLPTALLSTGLILLAFLSLACGLILDAVSRGRQGTEAPGLSGDPCAGVSGVTAGIQPP